jgi:outer membrane protein, heavy metal efflux system
MQMLPLGGKRALQRAVARRDVRIEEASRTAAQRSMIADAKAAFYDYRYYDVAIQITARNKQRLQQLGDISESRYRVGKAVQQDVMRARLEVTMLLQRTATLKQQRLTAMARLNTLMGWPASAPLPPAAPVDPATLPPLESLAPLVESNDAMLARETSMAARERAALALTRKDFTPDLSVGYMFQQRDGQPDMHGMQFTINLPIHREKLRQEVAEGQLRVRAAENSQQSRRLEASYELRQAYSAAETARQMIDLYDKAILPQAELARDSAQSSYVVGNTDFLTVVSGYTSIYSYELDYERQRADYQTALARIEALAGTLEAAPRAANNNAVPTLSSSAQPRPNLPKEDGSAAPPNTVAAQSHSPHSASEAH